jgi:hypothetical protein
MPRFWLTKDVRVRARQVAKQIGKEPWFEHRDAVLPTVYQQLQLGPYVPRPTKKRKRPAAPATASAECVVCFENEALVALVPCGHRKICIDCAERCDRKCPICRKRFHTVLSKIYD